MGLFTRHWTKKQMNMLLWRKYDLKMTQKEFPQLLWEKLHFWRRYNFRMSLGIWKFMLNKVQKYLIQFYFYLPKPSWYNFGGEVALFMFWVFVDGFEAVHGHSDSRRRANGAVACPKLCLSNYAGAFMVS